MDAREPRVTVGVPVYNGEKFLEEALQSVLDQTFDDYEVVISDNASDDSTSLICDSFVGRDSRFRYFRNDSNVGASANYRRVFELARGEYFCWLPSDEAMEAKFLERCVALLDEEPETVLAFPRYFHRTGSQPPRRHTASENADLRMPSAYDRVAKLIRERIIGPNWPIFGVYRTSVLKQTRLIRPVIGADDYLTLEVALLGPLGQVPEELYVLRSHPDAWHQARHSQGRGLAKILRTETVWAAEWFDPANRSMRVVFPHWRRLREFFLLFVRADERVLDRTRMVLLLPSYALHRWRRLLAELVAGGARIVALAIGAARRNLHKGPDPA